MRFGDKKVVLIDFYSYEIGVLESYFEEMALKGWMLEKVSNLYIKFNKIEPKTIKYTIDVIDGITSYGELDSHTALEYREKLKCLGWSFSCEFKNLQIFYKENRHIEGSVNKKEKEEIQCFFHDSLNQLFLRILLIAFIAFNQYISIFRRKGLDYFASYGNLLNLLFTVLFTVVCIIDLFRIIKFRMNYNVKEKRKSSFWIRFKGISILMIFILAFISLLNLLFTSSIEDFNFLLIIFSVISIISLIGYLLHNKRDTLKKKLTISSCFILGIVTVFIINNFIIANIFKNKNNGVKNRDYSLSIKDFNDEVYNEEDIYIDEDNSFLAHKIFYTANGKNMRLSYELFESNYKWMVNWNFNKMMDWFEKKGISYREIETSLPKDIKVYTNENEKNFILLSSNKIIEIIGLDDVENKEEVISIVFNKVFKDVEEII